jgi:hypothetical protein
MASVLPLKVKGAETTAAVTAPVPLPVRRPPSVVEPVPPPATESVPLLVGVKVKAPPVLVMVRPRVTPLLVTEEVAKVRAPVCGVPPPVCCIEETPLLIEEVATHCGTPLFQASIWPPVPVPKKVEVAIAVGTAEPAVAFARTVLAAIAARPMV